MKQKKMSKLKYFFMRWVVAARMRKAQQLTKKDNKTRLVINLEGKFVIMTRQELKALTKLNKKCLPIREVEKRAIYKTY